ncbi:MAG: helix-turn-helix transcriptional regulator [Clostridia bacterium]|nr:helix-turn-helix transcriptional regulator [Clostridia bacterium]
MTRRIREYSGHDLYCHYSIDDNPDPTDFYMHTHEWYEIYYIISGDASFLVEGTEYKLRENDILIMRSAEAHKLSVRPGTPYERIAVHFAPALISGVDQSDLLLEPFIHRPLGRGNLFRLPSASTLFDRFVNCPDRSAERVMLIVSVLGVLSAVYSAYFTRFSPERPGEGIDADSAMLKNHAGGNSQDGFGTTSALIDHINEHLFSDISLDDLCARFFVSRSQLERVFKKATGSSVWKYILIKRLIAARERILAGDKVYPAALSCGFKDYSSFYRAYSAHFGHAPGDDRRKSGS